MAQRNHGVRPRVHYEDRAVDPRGGDEAVLSLKVAPQGLGVPARRLTRRGGWESWSCVLLKVWTVILGLVVSLVECLEELSLARRTDEDHGDEAGIGRRHETVEASHAGTAIADHLGIHLRHLAQGADSGKDILLHRAVGEALAIPVAAKV